MPRMRWLLLVILLPFVELWSLLELGGAVGVGATLVYCIVAMVVGLMLMRRGRELMVSRIHAGDVHRRGPRVMLEDGFVVLAGGLIAFPGLVSDVIGILLAIPFVRHLLTRVVMGPASRTSTRPSPRPSAGADHVEIIPPQALPPTVRRRPVVIDVD